jgi:hypothetical protein
MDWLSASLSKLRDIRKGVAETFITIFYYLTAGHTAAWKTLIAPINIFLNEINLADRDELTPNWNKNMVYQLTTTLIRVCKQLEMMYEDLLISNYQSSLISSVIASSLTWTEFRQSDEGQIITVVKVLWYGSLALSISAIAAGSQQLICLNRINTYRNSSGILRKLLSGMDDSLANDVNPPIRTIRKYQAYLWQIPVMQMNGGLYVYAFGLCTLVVDKASKMLLGQYKEGVEVLLYLLTGGSILNWIRSWLCSL